MKSIIQKDVTITRKGQLTLPARIRREMKLGTKRKVRVAMKADGTVIMQALPDIMSLFGALSSSVPYDPSEKSKARHEMGRRAAQRG